MSKTSDKFEQQIALFHELIEQPGSQITWNDHIPDPDNPTQPRQIDVTIRRDGQLTIVECRIHQEAQDVNWIEELIGRRSSLRADTVIAVSASGFTKGAIAKAKAYGIVLRDMLTLTEEEIKAWGSTTCVYAKFDKYSKMKISLQISTGFRDAVNVDDAIKLLQQRNLFLDILEKTSRTLSENHPEEVLAHIKLLFSAQDIQINGAPVLAIQLEAEHEVITQEFETTSVVAYDDPGIDTLSRNSYSQTVGKGRFEIIKSSNIVSIFVDISRINNQVNMYFRSGTFDFGRRIEMRKLVLAGLEEMAIPADITFRIVFVDL